MAAEEMMRFGLRPKAALLSHSNFGSSNCPSAVKMREALVLIQQNAPWLEVDGEMHGDTALDAKYRAELMPRSTLSGEANLLVLPNIDAANISYNLLKTAAGGGIAIGPVLLGPAKPVHVLTPVDHRAAHRQHDRAHRGGRQRSALNAACGSSFSEFARPGASN
jgi:malate dehydrogenase (oxaloacetate-decarboxylating)(NADP+)